ncbi:MAG TPA: hypothetical protein DCY13_12960, partial [Verrucomicrobiales bacterium]|nr:hypothetical protein [Verrucomicrobiales bacterium]
MSPAGSILLGGLLSCAAVMAADPVRIETDFRAEFSTRDLQRDLYDEYQTQFWDSRDGLPQNLVGAMAFDADGHL